MAPIGWVLARTIRVGSDLSGMARSEIGRLASQGRRNMTVTPVKVFLFLLGGTAAAGATAYVAGVFDPILDRRPAISRVGPAEPGEQAVAELPPASDQPGPLEPRTQDDADRPEDATAPAGTPEQAAASPGETQDRPEAGETPAASDAAAPSPQEDGAAANEAAGEESASGSGQEMAALPPEVDAPPAQGSGAAGNESAGGESASAPVQEMAALPPDATSPQPEAPPVVVAPSFDVVRVESNGSIVIAGRAAPGADVEAVIGSRVIGTATADQTGAFAIVVDEPLKPGNYQIVLRSRTSDNVVATSIETAIVSIPETTDGQVLALVEEPGKPAELITVPKPASTSDTVEAAGGGGQDEPATEGAASNPQESAAAQHDEVEPGSSTEGEDAVAPPTAAAESATAPDGDKPVPASRVAVEAIEIEGNRIFIAGVADPRRLVRAYANDDFLGEAIASAAGRFLVEAERELPVGDYIIRVDALEPNGGKVVARAAVPFEREPGENIAAIAPPAASATPDLPASDSTTPKGDRLPEPAEADASVPAGTSVEGPATPEPKDIETPILTPSDVAAAPDGPQSLPGREPETAPAPQPAVSGTEKPATPDVAVAKAPEIADPVAPSDVPPANADTLSPRLQSVDSAVIIRRGDTLWRISRRVYGRGVRYSTIYLANQDQIQNPDLILPGQVFKVPDRTEEGEAADLTTMGDQAVETPVRQ